MRQARLVRVLLLAVVVAGTAGFEALATLSDQDRKVAVEFGELVEQTMAEGDAGVLEEAIDYGTIAKDSLSGLSLSSAEIDEYSGGLIQGMKQSGGLTSQIVANSYRFLRLKEFEGSPKLVFSLVSPEGAMNYHFFDFEVRNGNVRIVGFYPAATGEELSATLKRLLIPGIAEQKKGFLAKVFGEDRGPAILANYESFKKMGLAAASGDFAEVIRQYDTLDDTFKEDKLAMVMVQTAYSMTGDDENLTAISEKYRKKFPRDASLPLMMFDSLFVQKRWNAALAALDEIGKMVGGDPYLDVSRGGVYLEQGNYETALEHAERGAAGAPSIELAHWMVATIAAGGKNYERVATACRTLRDFGYYFAPELMADPVYAEFIESPPARALFAEEKKRMAEDGVTLDDFE